MSKDQIFDQQYSEELAQTTPAKDRNQVEKLILIEEQEEQEEEQKKRIKERDQQRSHMEQSHSSKEDKVQDKDIKGIEQAKQMAKEYGKPKGGSNNGGGKGGTHDNSSFLIDFAAGGISAAVAKTATAPIERVKLIMQTQDANPYIKSGRVPRYSGISDCFKRVYQDQGLKAFWRGNLTNVLRYFPTQAFNFAFKDKIKSIFPNYDAKKEFSRFVFANVISGGLAGAGSLCIVYPLDYARTRLASDVGKDQKSFNGLADCIIKTARGPAGIRGLYNGFTVSVIGIMPYRGVYFGMYDTLAGINPYQKESGITGLVAKFGIAQTTAITAGYASYPFDTVRRRLQMQSELPKSEWNYSGMADCFNKILKEEGISAFYKGAASNVLRTVGAALVLVLYGEVKKALGVQKI